MEARVDAALRARRAELAAAATALAAPQPFSGGGGGGGGGAGGGRWDNAEARGRAAAAEAVESRARIVAKYAARAAEYKDFKQTAAEQQRVKAAGGRGGGHAGLHGLTPEFWKGYERVRMGLA